MRIGKRNPNKFRFCLFFPKLYRPTINYLKELGKPKLSEELFSLSSEGRLMEDVIKRIVEAEKEAEGRIERAKQEAKEIIRKAKEEAKKIEEETIKRAEEESQNLIEKARIEGEEEAKKILEEGENEISKIREKAEANFETAIREAVELVRGA
ncbi:V/A-type H+-transporting ATPase subunit G/H [Thermococcus stetteri]|nr:V/A-type H+-transporting ATPase subunit G/H [Thermococcus stetteri]